MIKKQYAEALKRLHQLLSSSDVSWCITGKTNLALQGIDVEPSKIVILVKYEDIERILAAFSGFDCSDIEELENGEALEFTLYLENVKIIVCAEYTHGIYRQLQTRNVLIAVDGIFIPCFSLEAEKEAYKKLGMPENAALIK